MSETSKYRHLTLPYCQGCGIDIASQGDPVVNTAFQLDLPKAEFDRYNSNNPPHGPIQLRGHAEKLPIEDDSLGFLYSSHLLEDFADWTPLLKEWVRVIRPGGYLIILIPDKERWNAAIANGQPPNCAHRHEGKVFELSSYAADLHLEVVKDELTNITPEDYSILFVGRKLP